MRLKFDKERIRNTRKPFFSFSISLIASSVALGLHAEQNNLDDTMVEVGSQTPTKISDISSSVWVVDNTDIKQQLETGAGLKAMLGKLVPRRSELTWP